MAAVLAAVEALSADLSDPALAVTVAAAVHDPAAPLEPLLRGAAPLLRRAGGSQQLLLRVISALVSKCGESGGSEAKGLFDEYRRSVAWPVLADAASRSADALTEVCSCVYELAERSAGVQLLHTACVEAIERHVERLGSGLGDREGEDDALSGVGACELAATLCQHDAWRDGFAARLLPAVLRLLSLESAASLGLDALGGEPADDPAPGAGDDECAGGDEVEGASVQARATQTILRRVAESAPKEQCAALAAALWATVRELLPTEDELVHRWGAGGKQTLGLSLACDFHPLLFAANAGKEGFGEWADARDDALFWELLRECLLDPRRAVREQALALLGHATALGDAGSAEWDGSRAAWQAFLRLYETLQQFAVHLTTDVWPGIVSLFEAGEELRGPRPSHPALQVNEWAAVLFRRGLASENHAVQKLVLFSILEGDLYGHRHARVTDDVIFGSEASVLHTSLGLWLYRQVTDDDDDSEVALLLREFFSRHLEAIAAPEGGEGAAAAFLLRLVEYLHSIPDTVTSRARMTLIGILEHLRLPSSGAALIGDRGLRELRGIIVDQLPMEHSEGARRKILEAVLSATCRFAAPVDGQQTDCVSFGAVARMLVHYPVELLAGQAASTVLSSFVQRLGSEWLVEGMSSLVSDYIEAGEGGQRMETAPSQLAVMLALAVHFDDAAVLCQQVLAPAVDALQTAWRHVYAPAGRAEAAIELLDAVLKPPRSRVVDDCLVPLIAAGADDIAAYLRACIERLLAPLTPGSPRIEGTGGARTNLRATAAQYAQFTVRCCSLLCESGEADRFEAVAVAAADLAAGAVAAHPERDTLGGTARNLARMDALATLVVVMPSGHRGAGTPAELAGLLTASASVELEAQDSDVRYSAGDRYGESWSERRNLFCRWKWDCVCVLVSQLSPFGAEPSDGQVAFPVDDSAGLATALIAVVEGSADALDMLTPGQGAAAASNMLLPIFDMLKEVLPWYVTRGDGHTRQQCHERLERVVEPAWTAFAEVDKKTLPFLLSAIALFLPASLWDDEGWHLQVDGSKQPSPFKRMYARLAEMGASNRSTRVMSTLSLHCCRLWTKHPHTASLYLDELVAICCYTNAHDESSKAHQHSATLLHIDAKYCPACVVEYPTVFIARDAEETARQAARLFAQFLCTSAAAEHAADADAEGLHYGLAVSLLRKLMGRNELPVYASPAYAPGSDVWKLKIVLWQAICVLVACVRPESAFALEVHTAVAAMIKRNEAPTVRQYADAAAVQLVSRCPELLETPGWIQGTLRDFKSAPQVAMSLCVVVVALAPRLTAPARSRYFHELFTPMVTWVSAGNRPLRALAMVAVARLIDLADEARRAQAVDKQDADVDACGWPDLAHDEYCPWLQAYLRGSPEGRTFTQQLGPFLDAFQPEELCSPITTASRPDDAPSSAEEHLRTLRQFPTSVYELIKDSFKGSMSLVFADEDSETTWQPGALDPALPDYVLRYEEELKKSEASAKGEAPGSEGPAVADEAAPEIAFQRKITPNVPDESADDEAAPTPQAAIDLELIVVGSLIEDVPSLGGLARSCEIFNASKLILADRLIPTKPQFISTSVTAGRWVPLSFVAPPDLHDFLGEARRTGSTVVGVTHPAPVGDRTVRTLDAFEFPRRTMLLLGDPRLGLPASLLDVVDVVVALPAQGFGGPLQPHVGGSVCVWEYTRQHRV